MFLTRVLTLASAAAVLAGLHAQTFTATLQGTVTDSTGAVVPNANVTLVNEATSVKQAKVTDSRGAYLFTLVPPGVYKMTVDMKGFQTSVRSGMALQVQQQADVDIVLYCCSAYRAMNAAALRVYQTIRSEGTQKSLIPMMQSRADLYKYLGYHDYEHKLDELFAKGKQQ